MKLIRTLRNNWKKTVFFSFASVFGGSWAKRKWEDEELRREFCIAANAYGQEVNGLTREDFCHCNDNRNECGICGCEIVTKE